MVKNRLKALGIADVYMGQENKSDALEEFMHLYDLKKEEVVYMGDDMPDYEVMQKVGIATCPADACAEIKALSIYVSHLNGGKGCGRDIIEQVMRLQGKWS